MKKILITVKVLFVLCCIQPLTLMAQDTKKDHNSSAKTDTWEATKNNSWPGVIDKEPYWNRIDEKGKLLQSADRKSWEEDADGMWADKDGVFYKIDGNKLVQSTDGGSTWTETPLRKWHAVDGRCYKLDRDRVVLVSK